jgi:mRNA-degrading endonuclease RelE of RelBE toxin-antitoxin system
MTYRLSFTKTAEKDLSKLPKKDIIAVLEACTALEAGQASANIKKLHPQLNGYRLRVGRIRVLFVYEMGNDIVVHAVKRRKDAYK